jgi:general secretion pathway protein L
MSAATLLIALHDEALVGLAVGPNGAPLGATFSEPARLGEAARRAAQVVAVVPGQAVTLLSVPRIARQRQRLLQALPYAVEEQLAQPVEDVHIVAPARIEGDQVPVACVAHADMRAWMARLDALGIQPDRMLPDMLLLPAPAAAASLARVGGRALVRSGADAGFAVEADALALMLGRVGEVREVFRAEGIADLLPKLAPYLTEASALDLLAGPYRPRHRSGAAGPWRAAAVLALAALLLGLLYQWLDYRALRQTHEALMEEARALYRQVVPDAGAVPDPVRMLRAESARRGGGSHGAGALPLLARVAPLLAGGTTTVRMDAIEYRGGSLEITLTTPDVPTLDGLRERLGALPGLRVELTGASPGEAGVQGRLRVQEGTP